VLLNTIGIPRKFSVFFVVSVVKRP
jgi:hypothetical protein